MTHLPPLRYLTGADVVAAMPPLPERLVLAEAALRGLAEGAELPPKIGVHPRPQASFAHAMPALLPGLAGDGSGDRLGMKWVSGNPANNAAGLAGIYGLLLLNDPVTTRADRDPGRRADHRGADGGNQRRGDPGVRTRGRRVAACGTDRGRRPGSEPRAGPRIRAAGGGARGLRPGPGAGGVARGAGVRHRGDRIGVHRRVRARGHRRSGRRGQRGVLRARRRAAGR